MFPLIAGTLMKHQLALALLAIAATSVTSQAHAGAVTVLGPGPAQTCYMAADEGLSAADYLPYCSMALAGMLSDRDRAATYVNRGVLKLSLNEANGAQDDFNAGLAINDQMGEAYVDRGVTLIIQKRYAEAIADIDKGIALGSKEAHVAYYDRAMADEALGNLQAAYGDYRQALLIEPNFSRASDELKRFKVVTKPSGT
jgi:tetratricopeptide (TPR) repeat protein